ncbi:hypothetical protein ACFQ8C_36430 [Streptomyces sp. NPDC056503]|uniref:hypothetical protein n=1 Tax=Streptomyces sp. NPDC056503 TaxID=3345842 RepID=UPI0036886D15
MMNESTEFYGMRPWRIGSEIIDCEDTPLGYVDVHNFADFLGVDEKPGEISLDFRLVEKGTHFRIRFAEVRELAIRLVDLDFPENRELFYAFDSLGDCVFEFEAATLSGKVTAKKVFFEVVS